MANEIGYNISAELQQKISYALELKKQIEAIDAEIRNELLENMAKHDIKKIDNELFSISLVSRNNYKAVDGIPADFAKLTLDTTKIGNYEKLNGEIPAGVKKTITNYIMYRAK
jgi:hypothetical protein